MLSITLSVSLNMQIVRIHVCGVSHAQLIYLYISCIFMRSTFVPSQVGFAEFNNTADNRANIGGTIIGAPIVGQ